MSGKETGDSEAPRQSKVVHAQIEIGFRYNLQCVTDTALLSHAIARRQAESVAECIASVKAGGARHLCRFSVRPPASNLKYRTI